MRWAGLITILLFVSAGCTTYEPPDSPPAAPLQDKLFGPISMRLDTFSKIKTWTDSGKPDGVEAVVEFDDRFGDRTKAAGDVLFELFDYRTGFPDVRGSRIVNPWSAPLRTFEQQKAHWDKASGAYSFRLACDGLAWGHPYVLTAIFDSDEGHRFFAQIILQPQSPEKNAEPTTNESGPGPEPGPRIPQP